MQSSIPDHVIQWMNSLAHLGPPHQLVAALNDSLQNVLVTQIDNFTPPERTPWGGSVIPQKYKSGWGISEATIVGESWEISGHPSFPNHFNMVLQGENVDVPIEVLESVAGKALYGNRNFYKFSGKMPFLVKLLNSGSWTPYFETLKNLGVDSSLFKKDYHQIHHTLSLDTSPAIAAIHQEMLTKNLSVQVHPPKGLFLDKPSKTEAWMILETEKGAGIYLGLKEGVTQSEFEQSARRYEDLSVYLNFVEVKAGEGYFIPSGTLHAIGAGVLLVEPQETSETTFRAYDWGRLYQGKPRPLHIEEVIASTDWYAEQGKGLVDKLRINPFIQQKGVELMVDIEEFQHLRLTLDGYEYRGDTHITEIQGYIIAEGTVDLITGNHSQGSFSKGQSFILPAALGRFTLRSKEKTVLFQTKAFH